MSRAMIWIYPLNGGQPERRELDCPPGQVWFSATAGGPAGLIAGEEDTDAGEDETATALHGGGAGEGQSREEDSDRDERQPPPQVGEEA